MPTQTIKSIQQLFDGDVNANVPNIGWRTVELSAFDRTHASDTNQSTFNTSFRTNSFTPGGNLQLNSRCIMPPDRRDNTDIYFKWHFSVEGTGTGDVVLELNRIFANLGSAFSANVSQQQIIAISGVDSEHYAAVFGPFNNSVTIDAAYMLRFDRLGGDVADTYADDIFHIAFRLWYQSDRIAVPNHLSPYYS